MRPALKRIMPDLTCPLAIFMVPLRFVNLGHPNTHTGSFHACPAGKHRKFSHKVGEWIDPSARKYLFNTSESVMLVNLAQYRADRMATVIFFYVTEFHR